MKSISRLLTGILCAVLLVPMLKAQTSENKAFAKEELEQLVAPIALYPDALVAQVLMASTYPLEVVSAARWVKANPKVTGKALEDAMQKEPWDPSVKSLTAFPQVLDMMNSKLDWTQKLGDAFLAQQKEVMAAVQTLRLKAEAQGNLKTTKEQVVTKEQQANTTVVKIEPANPQVVYVPTYDPVAVYGPWPYPAYPPYYYYPPGYAPGAALFTFGVGLAVGAALWGDCDWGHGDVNINAQKFNNFNRTNVKGGNWQHNVEHRKGVGYRDNATREKYGRGQQGGADARESFRGRAEQGRRDIAGGAADRMKGGGVGERGGIGDRGGVGERGGVGDRGGVGERGGIGDRAGPSGGMGERRDSVRPTAGTREAGGFQGVGGGGAETRGFSDRGAASRGSAGGGARAGGGGFSGGGGARGGGGGGRGGGGRR
jgi:hypothetical protein